MFDHVFLRSIGHVDGVPIDATRHLIHRFVARGAMSHDDDAFAFGRHWFLSLPGLVHASNFASPLVKDKKMSYIESARRGEIVSTTRYAILNGSLWAIGLAWSTAIRSIVMALIPSDTREVVLGELLAAVITTGLAVGISVVVSWRCCDPSSEVTVVAPPRSRGSRA